jgi:hypothetical protein
MKRFLFLSMLCLLLAGNLFAADTLFISIPNYNGYAEEKFNRDSTEKGKIVYVMNSKDSIIIAKLESLLYDSKTYYLRMFTDTTSVTSDSASVKCDSLLSTIFPHGYVFTIQCDSAIYYSDTPDFKADHTGKLKAGETFTTKKVLDSILFPDLYYKKVSDYPGAVEINVWLEGN